MNMKTRFCKHEYVRVPEYEYTLADKTSLARLNGNLELVKCRKCNSKKWVYKKMGGKIIKIEEDNEDKSIPQVKFQFMV